MENGNLHSVPSQNSFDDATDEIRMGIPSHPPQLSNLEKDQLLRIQRDSYETSEFSGMKPAEMIPRFLMIKFFFSFSFQVNFTIKSLFTDFSLYGFILLLAQGG